VFTTKKGIEGIADGKLTLGADAAVAAGPLGRAASAGTDQNFTAEVYSYSRNRGLFAGIAINGSALTIDGKANARFYKHADASASDIINGTLKSDDPATQRFLAAVSASTTPPATTHAVPAATAAPASPAAPTAPAAPSPSGAAKTFPMEDQKPGQEPK